jgi:hypothetical protein
MIAQVWHQIYAKRFEKWREWQPLINDDKRYRSTGFLFFGQGT